MRVLQQRFGGGLWNLLSLLGQFQKPHLTFWHPRGVHGVAHLLTRGSEACGSSTSTKMTARGVSVGADVKSSRILPMIPDGRNIPMVPQTTLPNVRASPWCNLCGEVVASWTALNIHQWHFHEYTSKHSQRTNTPINEIVRTF